MVLLAPLLVSVLDTLGHHSTELENKDCCGPTVLKSLGTLFILSPIKVVYALVELEVPV